MKQLTWILTVLLTLAGTGAAMAQKTGGVLRVYHRDSPASMSIHEEGTIGVLMPMMAKAGSIMRARKGSPSQPRARLASVMPSWVAEM